MRKNWESKNAIWERPLSSWLATEMVMKSLRSKSFLCFIFSFFQFLSFSLWADNSWITFCLVHAAYFCSRSIHIEIPIFLSFIQYSNVLSKQLLKLFYLWCHLHFMLFCLAESCQRAVCVFVFFFVCLFLLFFSPHSLAH